MRLLLDSHVPSVVARRLRDAGIDAFALPEWRDGSHRASSDEMILLAAYEDDRVLLTYDLKTVPRLLQRWSSSNRHHAGVLLVDERTLRPNDIGGLVRAVMRVVAERDGKTWRDQVLFLPP